MRSVRTWSGRAGAGRPCRRADAAGVDGEEDVGRAVGALGLHAGDHLFRRALDPVDGDPGHLGEVAVEVLVVVVPRRVDVDLVGEGRKAATAARPRLGRLGRTWDPPYLSVVVRNTARGCRRGQGGTRQGLPGHALVTSQERTHRPGPTFGWDGRDRTRRQARDRRRCRSSFGASPRLWCASPSCGLTSGGPRAEGAIMKKVITVGEILVEIMATEVGDGFLEPIRWSAPSPRAPRRSSSTRSRSSASPAG